MIVLGRRRVKSDCFGVHTQGICRFFDDRLVNSHTCFLHERRSFDRLRERHVPLAVDPLTDLHLVGAFLAVLVRNEGRAWTVEVVKVLGRAYLYQSPGKQNIPVKVRTKSGLLVHKLFQCGLCFLCFHLVNL